MRLYTQSQVSLSFKPSLGQKCTSEYAPSNMADCKMTYTCNNESNTLSYPMW